MLKVGNREYSDSTLYLNVAHYCNLSCIYCAVNEGHYHGGPNLMTEEIAKKATRVFLEEYCLTGRVNIIFFGGEPLLNFPVIKKIVPFAATIAEKQKRPILFYISTNGTVMSKEIVDFIIKFQMSVQISIDGPGDIHNENRPFRNGMGSFNIIKRNIKNILGKVNRHQIKIIVTFTKNNLKFSEYLEFLQETFPQINIYFRPSIPICNNRGLDYKLNQEDFDTLINQYEIISSWILKKVKNKCYKFIQNEINCFKDILKYVHFRINKHSPCAVGFPMICIIPNGDIYPCHGYAEINKRKIGNVIKGNFWLNSLYKLRKEINVNQRKPCCNCWNRYLCGGECPVLSENIGKPINNIWEEYCDFKKKKLELATSLYNHLEKIDKFFMYNYFKNSLQDYLINTLGDKTLTYEDA